ncbi:MAG: VWA domain-containing protein [Candidatus Muirbacterium halophilum]|nr:VWA domain-containing protein [Candidatus Muirbacterium halophilum]
MKKYFLIYILLLFNTFYTFTDHIITEKTLFDNNNNIYDWKGRIVKNNGITVNNLKNENFAVFYNKILDFDTVNEPEPCAIAVLMDSSNSLKKHQKKVFDMFFNTLSSLPSSSDKAYVMFNNRVKFLKTLDGKEPEDWLKIQNIEFSGPTALYDSIYHSSKSLGKSNYKNRFIIVISDGIDEITIDSPKNMSEFSLEHTIEKAKENNVKVIFIPPMGDRIGWQTIKKITQETSGEILKETSQLKKFWENNLRKRFSIIVTDPFLISESETREVSLSIDYKGDSLTISQTLDIKDRGRFFAVEKTSYLKEYKVILENIVIDYPNMTFIMYSYFNNETTKPPSKKDIRVTAKCEIKPINSEFSYDPVYNQIVIDKSNSMTKVWDKQLEYVSRLINRSKDFYKYSINIFDADSRILNTFEESTDLFHLKNRIKPGGSTRLYDNIIFSLMNVIPYNFQKNIILFSDGKDERYEGDEAKFSKYSLKQTMGKLKNNAVPLYAVNFNENANHNVLSELSIYSGGAYLFKPTENVFNEIFEMIEKDLRGFYNIKFKHPLAVSRELSDMIEIIAFKDNYLIDIENITKIEETNKFQ